MNPSDPVTLRATPTADSGPSEVDSLFLLFLCLFTGLFSGVTQLISFGKGFLAASGVT